MNAILGTHNPNFKADFNKKPWTQKEYDDYLMEINKKDFFTLLKTYSHLSNFDEEVETDMIVSDNLGHDITIMFIPFFNVTRIGLSTRFPNMESEQTEIELWDIAYTTSYKEDPVLEMQDFNKTELAEIKSIISEFCG